MRHVLVTGAFGQLGSTFQRLAHRFPGLEFVWMDRNSLDITNPEAVSQALAQRRYSYLLNCAAYTAVDQAESEPEAADRINHLGACVLAQGCADAGVHLVHISTDYVFDGTSSTAYTPKDAPNPQGVYGATKWKGEQCISRYAQRYTTVRTSWLYDRTGKNFVQTMLRLSQTQKELKVVNDQIGSPTFTEDLAMALGAHMEQGTLPKGITHFSNTGSCSWFEFARAIFEERGIDIPVLPVSSAAYQAAAPRPTYSLLALTPQYPSRPWRTALKDALTTHNQTP
ncbi:MAG: dTDP-4-dehydrorhamnose reductase [Flavobacteriaceae bacterium]